MKKMIRLAVIGSTSSGKTYLLSDLIESFSRLDYRCVEELDSLYANPFDFRFNVGEEYRQTAVVACRKYNEYRGKFVNNEERRNFNLGFLDIPGEIFEPSRINRFIKIIGELYRLEDYFICDIYKKGRQTSKVLRFIGPDGKSEPTVDYQEMLNDIYLKRGYVKKDFLPDFLRKVKGKRIVTNFFEFDTDSVLEAITEAVPYFSTDSQITPSEFVQDKVGMDLFYFFYTLYATDVVLCDKFVMPENVKGAVVPTGSPVMQLQQLYSIDKFKPCQKKYYMAFRGADALINDCLSDLAQRNFGVDQIYALIVFLLEYKLEGKNICHHNDLDKFLGTEICNYIKEQERGLTTCVDKYLKHDYTVQPYYNRDFAALCHGEDLTRALGLRIQTAIRDFVELRSDLPEKRDIFMAPNVFLTSSAIASEMFKFEVTGNNPSNVRKMSGPCASYDQRACFGTLQLAMSLMTRNNIAYSRPAAEDISMIQDYIS